MMEFDIDDVKAVFATYFFEGRLEESLHWGYYLYLHAKDPCEDENDKLIVFTLLQKIFQHFCMKDVKRRYGNQLKDLANLWEDGERKDDTILGTIIQNLIQCNLEYEESRGHESDITDHGEEQMEKVQVKIFTKEQLEDTLKKIQHNGMTLRKKGLIPYKVCMMLEIRTPFISMRKFLRKIRCEPEAEAEADPDPEEAQAVEPVASIAENTVSLDSHDNERIPVLEPNPTPVVAVKLSQTVVIQDQPKEKPPGDPPKKKIRMRIKKPSEINDK